MSESTAIAILLGALILRQILMQTRFRGSLTRRIQKLRLRKIRELKQKRSFSEIVSLYKKRAARSPRRDSKQNLLGLAALWDHDTQTAIDIFERLSLSVIGAEQKKAVRNNLGIAYLQAGQYPEALEVFAERRASGYVLIVPYVFALLCNGKQDEAKEFYAAHPVEDEWEAQGIGRLLAYAPDDKSSLEDIHRLVDEQVFWLYDEALRHLLDVWQIRSFFVQQDRYEVLSANGRALLRQIDSEPSLFTNPKLRWFRSVLAKVVPSVGTYQSCANLFGLIFGLERWIETLGMTKEWQHEAELFWRCLVHTFSQTVDIEDNDVQKERQRIRSLLPADAKPLLEGKNPQCEVYISASADVAIRVEEIYNARKSHRYVDVLSSNHVDALVNMVQPLLPLLSTANQGDPILQPFVFNLVCYPERISPTDVRELLMKLPRRDSEALSGTGFTPEGVQILHKTASL